MKRDRLNFAAAFFFIAVFIALVIAGIWTAVDAAIGAVD